MHYDKELPHVFAYDNKHAPQYCLQFNCCDKCLIGSSYGLRAQQLKDLKCYFSDFTKHPTQLVIADLPNSPNG